MTKKELLKIIDIEVAKIANEPIREPHKELPKFSIKKLNPAFNPILKNEEEINEYLFKGGMKNQ